MVRIHAGQQIIILNINNTTIVIGDLVKQAKNNFVVYILRTNKNTLYTGQTSDLEKRLNQHKEGKGSKYVRSFNSFELVHVEKYNTRSEALKREIEIKKLSRKQKDLLLKNC